MIFAIFFTLTVFLFVEPSSWSSVQAENKAKWPGVPAYIAPGPRGAVSSHGPTQANSASRAQHGFIETRSSNLMFALT